MQKINLIYLAISLLAVIANGSVLARGGGGHGHGHGHSHFNLGINYGGFYGPGFYGYGGFGNPFYYPPYYAYPPTVIVPTEPPVYIQREQVQSAQPQSNYWYHCQDPEGYYPYVKNCPGGWQPVAPQPPAQ